jgi:hypothetical protein
LLFASIHFLIPNNSTLSKIVAENANLEYQAREYRRTCAQLCALAWLSILHVGHVNIHCGIGCRVAAAPARKRLNGPSIAISPVNAWSPAVRVIDDIRNQPTKKSVCIRKNIHIPA